MVMGVFGAEVHGANPASPVQGDLLQLQGSPDVGGLGVTAFNLNLNFMVQSYRWK